MPAGSKDSFSGEREDEIAATVISLRALYQSMMEELAELMMVTSHLHARGSAAVDWERQMQSIFDQVAKIDRSGAKLRLGFKELERLALAPSPSAGETVGGNAGKVLT